MDDLQRDDRRAGVGRAYPCEVQHRVLQMPHTSRKKVDETYRTKNRNSRKGAKHFSSAPTHPSVFMRDGFIIGIITNSDSSSRGG